MKRKFNYKKWRELTATQQEQVRTSKGLATCSYIKKPGMMYNIDEEGNYTHEYRDPYILAGYFS